MGKKWWFRYVLQPVFLASYLYYMALNYPQTGEPVGVKMGSLAFIVFGAWVAYVLIPNQLLSLFQRRSDQTSPDDDLIS